MSEFWETFYGPAPTGPTGSSFWETFYGDDEESEEEKQYKERIRRMAESAKPPEPRDPVASLNQYTTEQAYAGARDLLQPHPEAHFPEHEEPEELSRPDYAPELGPTFLTNREGPLEQLGQGLQVAWSEVSQRLQEHQQQAMAPEPRMAQMTQPPIEAEVSSTALEPDQFRLKDFPRGQTFLEQYGEVPEGRVTHGDPESDPFYRDPQSLGFAGHAIGAANVELIRTLEGITDIPTRMVEVGRAWGKASFEEAKQGNFLTTEPGKAAWAALTREGSTNPVSEWFDQFGTAVQEAFPEPETGSEVAGNMLGMMGMIGYEYALGGGFIRRAFGIGKKAEVTKEFTTVMRWLKGHPKLATAAVKASNTGRLATRRVAANLASYGPLDLGQVWTGDASLPHIIDMIGEDKVPGIMNSMNQNAGGRALFELILGAVADGIIEPIGAFRVVGKEGRAFAQATPGAASLARQHDIPLRDLEATMRKQRAEVVETVASENLRAHPATAKADADIDDLLVTMQHLNLDKHKVLEYLADGLTGRQKIGRKDVEQLYETLVRESGTTVKPGKADLRTRLSQVIPQEPTVGLPQITRPTVKKALKAREAAEATKAGSARELVTRGQEALQRAGKRYMELSREGLGATRSIGAEMEVFFDPALKRDMGLWGGSLLARAKGVMDRADFDATLRARFPAITDNILAQSHKEAQKVYEAYLKRNARMKGSEWSELVPGGELTGEARTFTMAGDVIDADQFGTLAEEAVSKGIKVGGHRWYQEGLLPWLTNVMGSEEEARLFLAMYSASSSGQSAGGGNITLAAQAMARFKSGQALYDPAEGIFLGYRGASVANTLDKVIDAFRLAKDPGTGINSIKYRNFYEALTGKDRTVVDIWMQRIYGYDYWKSPKKVQLDRETGLFKTEKVSPSFTPKQYEFVAADVDRIAWEMRPGGKLEDLGRMMGDVGDEGAPRSAVQAAIWVGAQIMKQGKASDNAMPAVELLARRLDELIALRGGDDYTLANVAKTGWAEAGAANYGALAYMSNATAGALLGLGVGDTWEERLKNSLKLGLGGAMGTHIAGRWTRMLRKNGGLKDAIALLWKNPTPPVKIPVAVEPGIRIPPTGNLGEQVTRLRATHNVVVDAVHDLSDMFGLKNLPEVNARTRTAKRIREGGLELGEGTEFEVGMNIVMPADASPAHVRAIMATVSDLMDQRGGFNYQLNEQSAGQVVLVDFRTKPTSDEIKELGRTIKEISRARGHGDEYLGFSLNGKQMASVNGTEHISAEEFLDILDEAADLYSESKPYRKRVTHVEDMRADYDFVEPKEGWERELISALEEAGGTRQHAEEAAVRLLERHRGRSRGRAERAAEKGRAPGGTRQFLGDIAEQIPKTTAREAGAGAVVGGAIAGTEGGGPDDILSGALIGGAAAVGGAKLLRATRIGRRLGWDTRGAIGDLTSFKDLPHKVSIDFQDRLIKDRSLVQDWLAEIEDANLEAHLDNLVGLRNLGEGSIRGMNVPTDFRKRIHAGVQRANEYINSLWDKPLTTEELRMLDQGLVKDVKPAYFIEGHPPFEGYNHGAARQAAQYKTGLSHSELLKQNKIPGMGDGFTMKIDGKEKFLDRLQATQVMKDRGAIGGRRKAAFGEEGFATREAMAAVRDVGGGVAAGGAIGGALNEENRPAGAVVGALSGAAIGIGSVRGRAMRTKAIEETAKKVAGRPGIIGQALEAELKKDRIRIKQFKSVRALRAWTAGNPESMVNPASTAAWLPGDGKGGTIAVLSDQAAKDLVWNQKDLISNIISEEDVRMTLSRNRKAGKEQLQQIRAALQLPGGYAKQAEASGVPEATLRYMDRLERKAEGLKLTDRQLRREALASTTSATRAAAGETPETGFQGTIRTRDTFKRFLGTIEKFNISSQSAEQRLADTFEAHRKATKMKKTVQHDVAVRREVDKIVRELGLDPKSPVLDLKPGTTKEQMLAIRSVIQKNTEDLDKIADYMNSHALTPDEEDTLIAHSTALTKQMNELLDRFSKTRSEYGRNLRALSLVAQRSFDPQNRQTWYLMAKQRHSRGMLTEAVRHDIDTFIASGDKAGLVDYIARLKPAPVHRKLVRLWKAGLLTSPKTHMRNNLGNAAMATLEELKDIPAYVADRAAILVAGRLGYKAEVTKAAKNLRMVSQAGKKGAKDGLKEFVQVMRQGDSEQAIREVAQKLDLIGDVRFDNTLLDAYTNLAFRSLGAEDRLWRHIASSRSMLEQAATMAKNEARGGKHNTAWMRKRTKEILNNPTDEMLLRAKEDAEFAVFQNSNAVAKWINRGKRVAGLGPVLEYTMPFVNTPMNIFARVVDYSPAGGVIAAKRAVQLLRKAEVTGAFDPRLQKEMVDRFGRASVGTIAMAVGLAFYLDNKMRVSYPKEAKEREKWKLTGEQDGSILVAGKWRQIRNVSPIGNLMLIGGAMGQLMDDPEVTNWPAIIEGAAGSTLEQFKEMPMLTGINTVSRAVDNWDYEAGRLGRNMARSFVPAIIRDLSRALDNTVRQTKAGPIQAAQGSTPFASRSLPPQVDVLGRKLTREQGPAGSFLDLFSSRTDKRGTSDPVVRTLLDLEVDIGPRQRIGGESDWQFYRRTEAQGQDLYRRLQAEINTAGFRALSREKQGKHLRSRIGVWRGRMTKAWDAQHPDYP